MTVLDSGSGAEGGRRDDEWGAVRVRFERLGITAGGCVVAIHIVLCSRFHMPSSSRMGDAFL